MAFWTAYVCAVLAGVLITGFVAHVVFAIRDRIRWARLLANALTPDELAALDDKLAATPRSRSGELASKSTTGLPAEKDPWDDWVDWSAI